MKLQILKPNLSAAIGLLLTLPAAYFFLINILNEMGAPGLYNAAQPMLENMGIRESMGWNINLLIAFGPVIALLLNLSTIVRFDWHIDKTFIDVDLRIERRWANWAIAGMSGVCLLILFIYLAGENCR